MRASIYLVQICIASDAVDLVMHHNVPHESTLPALVALVLVNVSLIPRTPCTCDKADIYKDQCCWQCCSTLAIVCHSCDRGPVMSIPNIYEGTAQCSHTYKSVIAVPYITANYWLHPIHPRLAKQAKLQYPRLPVRTAAWLCTHGKLGRRDSWYHISIMMMQ